ncbi:MAG: UbiD family decarboxylase [Acidobacteria bacterium]|nr:UbiD family decarboxylase [Acidobacteriota bacterium]
MAIQDLRDWIRAVDEIGELKVLRGAGWDSEIGTITELFHHREGSAALLFDEVPGYPKGYRVLSNTMNSMNRLALTLGMAPAGNKIEMVQAFRKRFREVTPVKARTVKYGPVLEHVYTGSDINLLKFPTPKWHELDGGRYIGTGSVDITRDPDEGWVNVGCYRVMIQDKQSLGFYISPGKHGRIQREKFFKRGEVCKVAVSFGHDPLLYMLGGLEIPYGVSEYEFMSGMKGEPVEVIEGEHTGLPIPATAEVVVEGEARVEDLLDEGPFGEWTGYYASSTRPEPVIRVKRLMHRENPILLGAPPTRPPCEYNYFRCFLRAALVWEQMAKAGVPDIKGVWCHMAGGSRLLTVVSIKQRYPGHARQAGYVAAQCHASAYLGRFTIVVDDDVDPANTDDVLWALATRTDPEQDIEILRRTWSGPLDPIIPEGQKGFNSRAIIDACRPYEWLDQFPPVAESSKALREKVLAKWGPLLFNHGAEGGS